MLLKITLAFGVLLAFLGGGVETAVAATPTTVTITYGRAATADEVKISVNVPAAAKAKVSEYDLRVVIAGQPERRLSGSASTMMLFNIIPGTKIHAYVTLKGEGLDSSIVYDGGSYTQPKFNSQASPSGTPTVTAKPITARPTPTSSTTQPPRATSTPTASVTATPRVTNTPPSLVPSSTSATTPTSTPTSDSTAQVSVVTVMRDHSTEILILMIVTFLGLGAFAFFRRRR